MINRGEVGYHHETYGHSTIFLWHCHGEVIDHFTGASASYTESTCNVATTFQNICERIKLSKADTKMTEVYAHVYVLS